MRLSSPQSKRLLVAGGLACSLAVGKGARPFNAADAPLRLVSNGFAGYISMSAPSPSDEFGYGVSLYSTAWPLTERPLRDFQIGLASIWIIPENRKINTPLLPTGTLARDNWPERGPSYRDVFQTIEGGLGFWASTQFGSTTAKFRMNGTANGYNQEVSSPGWGFGQTNPLRPDQMGIAQLSSRILVPPDGFTFKSGTNGELLGYAWMALPLINARSSTAGLPVPTGDQSWALFLNTSNCKGPVAFYTPSTWSRISRHYGPAVARGLDARPGVVAGGAIEVNTVPRFVAQDSRGATYSRVPRLQFPVDKEGRTVLIHNLTQYSKGALYRQVESWLAGGDAASGQFDMKAAVTPVCRANPLALNQGTDHLPIKGLEKSVKTKVFNNTTFGLEWEPSALEPWTKTVRRGSLPQYFKQEGKQVVPVEEAQVPKETGLKGANFPSATSDQSYTSPDAGDSVWRRPGPKAGPFKAKLSDGSVVTYYWYRFIDQPSLQDADLSESEKRRLQSIAEKIQRHWTLGKEYLPPPAVGKLVTLDPALLVTPPKGLEIGYVPIAVRQSPK